MATAAVRTEIIQLVVGMVGAAPGRDILTELEGVIDGGLTIDQLAAAIYANPLYSGETATALFPSYLPNAIFAENFLGSLLGEEVSEATMTAAVARMTSQLNAGTMSRGEAIKTAIDTLATSTIAVFADAKTALANKVAVAEYYSVTLAESSAELDVLMAVVDDVDSSATAVADGTKAVDSVIAANQGLTGLLSRLDYANKAKALFLVGADGDGNAKTSTTDAKITKAVKDAQIATGKEIANINVATDEALYTAAIPELQAALASAAQTILTAGLVAADKALVAAQEGVALLPGTNSVTGLEDAILANMAANEAEKAADIASNLAKEVLEGAVDGYNLNNELDILKVKEVFVYAGVLKLDERKTLVLGDDITEATNPGVTALLAAAQANQAAIAAYKAADTAVTQTEAVVNNLDLNMAGKEALENLTEAISFSTSSRTKATVEEINEQGKALTNEVGLANAAAQALLSDAVYKTGVETLRTDINALVFNTDDTGTIGDHDNLTAAAVAARFITDTAETAINTAFANAPEFTADIEANEAETTVKAGIKASLAALSANNAVARKLAFEQLEAAYNTASANNPLTTKYKMAAEGIVTATNAITALDTKLAAEAAAVTIDNDRKAADKVIAAAKAAFTSAGFEKPQDVDQSIEYALSNKGDIFLGGGTDATIYRFTDGDRLFVGAETVRNNDEKAGANGDNAVVEVWITGTSNAVITVETSAFGSEAVAPETYTITLSGVAAADVTYEDGFIIG